MKDEEDENDDDEDVYLQDDSFWTAPRDAEGGRLDWATLSLEEELEEAASRVEAATAETPGEADAAGASARRPRRKRTGARKRRRNAAGAPTNLDRGLEGRGSERPRVP